MEEYEIMSKIKEIIVEPALIYVGSNLRIKVKVKDDYTFKKSLVTESGLTLVTENRDIIRTEWGE